MVKRVTKTTLERVKAKKAAKKASVQSKKSVIEPENKPLVLDEQAFLGIKEQADEDLKRFETDLDQMELDLKRDAARRRMWFVIVLIAFFGLWVIMTVAVS